MHVHKMKSLFNPIVQTDKVLELYIKEFSFSIRNSMQLRSDVCVVKAEKRSFSRMNRLQTFIETCVRVYMKVIWLLWQHTVYQYTQC